MEDQVLYIELPDLLRWWHGAAIDLQPWDVDGDWVEVVPDDAKQCHGDDGAYDERADHNSADKQVLRVHEAYA